MNKYTELSEFEINKKVARNMLPAEYHFNEKNEQVELIKFIGDTNKYEVYGSFDPCNNVEQAWEIMMKYNICVTQGDDGLYDAFYDLYCDGDTSFYYHDYKSHEKPLVSAMLCFLEINK